MADGSSPPRRLTGATLFSGIGAPEFAAPSVDWKWAAEIDAAANAVRAYHWPGLPNFGNVKELPHDLPPVDLLAFGPPCQSFSLSGLRRGGADPRGALLSAAFDVVAAILPPWVLLENVPGLLSSRGGADFGKLLRSLGERGYSCAWRVLEASAFNLPLSRARLFLVGNLGNDFQRPARVLGFGDDASRDPRARRRVFAGGDRRGAFAVNLRGRAGGSRLEPSDLVTLRASGGGSSWSYVIQEGRLRRMTPEEGERAMGFPAGFTAVAGASATVRRRLIGNSIPVPPLRWILERIEAEAMAEGRAAP